MNLRRILSGCHLLIAMAAVTTAQSTPSTESTPPVIFPGATWDTVAPGVAGWSSSKLEDARAFYSTLPAASVIVVDHGRVVVQWGDPAQRIKISSMRKSLLSAMYGKHVRGGELDLNKTLAQLGIDDDPPLTEEEKKATVRMLLEARSGVYHSYVGGTPDMKKDQPARFSHAAGTFWYYNNWDFNVLGSIFEQQFHTKIGSEFQSQIAMPLQMQDFHPEDMYYLRAASDAVDDVRSIHPAYHFRMSARDLSRFGYLYLESGSWNGRQIIPKNWIAESTHSYSDTGEGEGYGYLWWVNGFDMPQNTFSARGALGKCVLVVPERKLVIVYLNHTEFPDNAASMTSAELKKLPTPSHAQMSQLFQLLLDAQGASGMVSMPHHP